MTPESDLVYRVYLALVERELAAGGVVDDTAVVRLHREASDRVAGIEGISSDLIVDGRHFSLRGTRPFQATEIRGEVNMSLAPVFERFRFMAITTRAARGQVSAILEELAAQLLGEPESPNFADLVTTAFFEGRTRSLLGGNADFASGLNGWTEYDNTAAGASPTDASELYTLRGEPNSVIMSLVSSSAADGTSLQRGIYREVLLQGIDLSNVFLTARYSTLDGRPENSFFGNFDASGVASISIEYLDAASNTLGTTNVLDTEDPALAGIGFYNAAESLQSNGANTIYRASGAGNRLVALDVAIEAERALGARAGEVAAVRLYALVGDYIGGDAVRALFGLIAVPRTCDECSAALEVHSLDLRVLD